MNKIALSVMTASSLGWWGSCHAELLGCLIEPDRVADVGSQSAGVLEKMHVERGDAVAAGQLVARLSAQVEKASVSVAEVKAKAEAETAQAQAAYELAQRKLERTRDLVKRDFVSDQALDQAEAEARVAEQRVEQARESQRVAHREYMLSNAQLSQREIRSPFSGLVIERYRTEGERIEREPVIRVARIDPLRIEAIVPAGQFGTIKAGQQATVRTDLPNFASLTAQVTLVDRVVDPASNSFRVRLTLPNPGNKIPSGLRCRIAFNPNDAAPATGTAGMVPAPGAATPAPASAGQVSPARWRDEPNSVRPRAGMRTVNYVMPAGEPSPAPGPLPSQPARHHAPQAAMQPVRFVSSTLKFAMLELARTSPGSHWLGDVAAPVMPSRSPRAVVKMAKAYAYNKALPHTHKATMLALSMDMPSMAQASATPFAQPSSGTATAAATQTTSAQRGMAQAPSVSGLRVASVR